jgi:hypothetical protein
MKHLFYVDRAIYLPCIAVIYWQLKIRMLGVMTSGPTEMKHEVAAVAHQVWLMIFTMNLSASVGDKEMPDESVCIGLHGRKLFNTCMCEIAVNQCLYK